MGAHPLDPRAQLLLAARVGEREHRLQVADLLELRDRLAADALRRRVGRDELGVLGLDRAQLVEQRVVLVVADLGVVEDVVAVAVVVELLAQLGGADASSGRRSLDLRGGRREQPREVVGARARPCPGTSVRSKCSGVTAMRPSATAARSVPVLVVVAGSSP